MDFQGYFYNISNYSRYDYCINIGTGGFDIYCPDDFGYEFYDNYKEDDLSFKSYYDIARDYVRKDCSIVYGVSEDDEKVIVECPG